MTGSTRRKNCTIESMAAKQTSNMSFAVRLIDEFAESLNTKG